MKILNPSNNGSFWVVFESKLANGVLSHFLFPYIYSLLCRHSLSLSCNHHPPQMSVEAKGTFLALWSCQYPLNFFVIRTWANKRQGMFPWLQQTFVVEEDCVKSSKNVCVGLIHLPPKGFTTAWQSTRKIDWLWGWFCPAGLIIWRKVFLLKKFSSNSFMHLLPSCWKLIKVLPAL